MVQYDLTEKKIELSELSRSSNWSGFDGYEDDVKQNGT